MFGVGWFLWPQHLKLLLFTQLWQPSSAASWQAGQWLHCLRKEPEVRKKTLLFQPCTMAGWAFGSKSNFPVCHFLSLFRVSNGSWFSSQMYHELSFQVLEEGYVPGQSVKQHPACVCTNAKGAFLCWTSENLIGCQKSAMSVWNRFCLELKPKIIVYHLRLNCKVYFHCPLFYYLL